ncbi:MAG: MATE family efflux transporter [Methanobrevibacter sp.]|nr:MATE family efflux transporter [Methanobrevibacter sp.]
MYIMENMQNSDFFVSYPKEAFWQLSKPLIWLSLFEAFYSFVDMFWISQMSSEAFFAIGVSLPLLTLILSFGKAIGVGTNSIISRELGENDFDDSYNSILHGIVACFLLGLVIMLSTFLLPDILILMDASSAMDLSLEYLTPIFLCSFVFLFSNLFISTLQAEGNSRTPSIIIILTNVLNLIIDPIFIFVFGWGVRGVAYATILCSSLTTIYLLYWYLSGKTTVVLDFKYFKPGIVYDIFLVAAPNLLSNVLWCISVMFFNKILIDQLGEIGILLYSTATRIQSLIVSPQKAFGHALVTVSGHLFGAKKYDELNKQFNYVTKIAVIIAIISTVAFFVVRDYGYALFSVTGMETSVFYIALAGIIIVPFSEVSRMSQKVLDGMGKSYHTLILTIVMIISEIGIVTLLEPIFTSGVCVLLGILIAEVAFAFVYYFLLKYLIGKYIDGEDSHVPND